MAAASDIASAFAPHLLDAASVEQYHREYASSGPYPHAVISPLVDEALLHATRREIAQLHFTPKETDIYKVLQTGDMANLDGLPAAEVARLPSLLRLRNALYSAPFRDWVQRITGCGPLSARKKDMSINAYRQGCHLLNHDDVISTRRVSFILYLPDPAQPWQPEWGGALELYPVKTKGTPADVPSKVIPPQWNQFVFFTVLPGHSFHSVEEVVHPAHSRISISGWFHRPQEGEEGFTPEDEHKEAEIAKTMSSLESLSAKENAKDFVAYPDSLDPPLVGSPLTPAEKQFLSQFLNPAYLLSRTQHQLVERFGDDSHLLLSDILRADLAQALETALRAADARDGFQWWADGQGEEATRIKPHAVGTNRAAEADDEAKQWSIAGPPHKQRYAVLTEQSTPATAADLSAAPAHPLPPFPTEASALLRLLSTVLFPSSAFRHWLANLTQLVPLSARPFEARRFRPGLDYTLARSDTEACLDVALNLTPDVAKPAIEQARQATKAKTKKAKTAAAAAAAAAASSVPSSSAVASSSPCLLSPRSAKQLQTHWSRGDLGGWECFMAPHDGDEDPTVYKSGGGQTRTKRSDDHDDDEEEADTPDADNGEEEDEDEEDESGAGIDADGDESDGVLLHLPASFNTLSVVLRDAGVLRFVKYLSASAGGSRWDVMAEFEVGSIEAEAESEPDSHTGSGSGGGGGGGEEAPAHAAAAAAAAAPQRTKGAKQQAGGADRDACAADAGQQPEQQGRGNRKRSRSNSASSSS